MFNDAESEPFLREPEKRTVGQEKSATPIIVYRNPSLASRITSHLLVALIVSVLWGASLRLLSSHQHSAHVAKATTTSHKEMQKNSLVTGAKFSLCGNSTEQATQKGCEYDILSNHWVPAPCMDQESVQEYQSDNSWFGYKDEERTQILSIDQMSGMAFYYTSMRDHILHCAMLWRKQFRAFFQERSSLDSIIVDEEHTMHCSEFLVNMTERGPDFSKEPIKVFVGFAGCYSRDHQNCIG